MSIKKEIEYAKEYTQIYNECKEEFIESAWNWIEPYFVAQKICKDSIEALRENFINRMKML